MDRNYYNNHFKQLTFSIHSPQYYLLTDLAKISERVRGGIVTENKMSATILEKWLKTLGKKIKKEDSDLDLLIMNIWHDV